MKTREQLRVGFARLLKELRVRHGLSKSKMSDLLFIDDHTWSRYETGESAPSVADFAYIFAALQEDAIIPVLDTVYGKLDGLSKDSPSSALRAAAADYIMHYASDRTIRALDYILIGRTGSNVEPKMQELLMLDHLPLESRVSVAYMIRALYQSAEARGELVGCDHIMPDTDIFEDGLNQAEDACRNGKDRYTTFVERQK